MGFFSFDRRIDPVAPPWGYPRGRGTPWTPEKIVTAMWFDAADEDSLIIDSGVVSQWNDKSGNDRHATQSSTARPTFVSSALNNLPVLRFDGSNDCLLLTSVANGVFRNIGQASIFAVAINNGGDSSRCIFLATTSSTTYSRAYSFFQSGTFEGGGRRIDGNAFHGMEVAASGYIIGGVELDYANAEMYLSLNGERNARGGFQTAGLTSDTNSALVSIGGKGGSDRLKGDIAEIIICLYIPSAEVRQKIEGYLAHKWGLADNLSSEHPYKEFFPRDV